MNLLTLGMKAVLKERVSNPQHRSHAEQQPLEGCPPLSTFCFPGCKILPRTPKSFGKLCQYMGAEVMRSSVKKPSQLGALSSFVLTSTSEHFFLPVVGFDMLHMNYD